MRERLGGVFVAIRRPASRWRRQRGGEVKYLHKYLCGLSPDVVDEREVREEEKQGRSEGGEQKDKGGSEKE